MLRKRFILLLLCTIALLRTMVSCDEELRLPGASLHDLDDHCLDSFDSQDESHGVKPGHQLGCRFAPGRKFQLRIGKNTTPHDVSFYPIGSAAEESQPAEPLTEKNVIDPSSAPSARARETGGAGNSLSTSIDHCRNYLGNCGSDATLAAAIETLLSQSSRPSEDIRETTQRFLSAMPSGDLIAHCGYVSSRDELQVQLNDDDWVPVSLASLSCLTMQYAVCRQAPWLYDNRQQGDWATMTTASYRNFIPANKRLSWCPPQHESCWSTPGSLESCSSTSTASSVSAGANTGFLRLFCTDAQGREIWYWHAVDLWRPIAASSQANETEQQQQQQEEKPTRGLELNKLANYLSLGFFAAASLGVFVLTMQSIVLHRHTGGLETRPKQLPPISVLKPLCGVDDGMWENLLSFASLDYPEFEVLLGVRSPLDAAFPMAQRACREFPNRFRIVIQDGEYGRNPKVNQLVTLQRNAKYDLLLVSDSNTRVTKEYLLDVANGFSNPQVGCVTHPIVGTHEARVGSFMDNLQLATNTAGVVALYHTARRTIVVGKSMGVRRNVLEAIGGFEAFADVLAEDYLIGERVTKAGRLCVLGQSPIYNVSSHRSVNDFFERYRRWYIIQSATLPRFEYFGQLFLHVLPLATLAVLFAPGLSQLLLWAGIILSKTLVDVSVVRAYRSLPMSAYVLASIVLKDALLFVAWTNGLFVRTVNWRGNPLRVHRGSYLTPDPSISANNRFSHQRNKSI